MRRIALVAGTQVSSRGLYFRRYYILYGFSSGSRPRKIRKVVVPAKIQPPGRYLQCTGTYAPENRRAFPRPSLVFSQFGFRLSHLTYSTRNEPMSASKPFRFFMTKSIIDCFKASENGQKAPKLWCIICAGCAVR